MNTASPTSQQPSPALTPATAGAIFTESSSLRDSPATFASSTIKETDSYASAPDRQRGPTTPNSLHPPRTAPTTLAVLGNLTRHSARCFGGSARTRASVSTSFQYFSVCTCLLNRSQFGFGMPPFATALVPD
ncbi:hypothetical protein B0T09DRAFT_63118 [Sordaria sp. MPI-SDFR-AT-0083]|nr:hypothetical protein B0T09DRAFT_63118 [Sordaria sp. MPI-SDFR-AT-0083]